MKKFTSLFFVLVLYMSTVLAQTQSATFLTTKVAGNTFSFDIAAKTANSVITVKYMSSPMTPFIYIIGTAPTTVNLTLLDGNFWIEGAGINYFKSTGNSIISMALGNWTDLAYLDCESNMLGALDVSKNTALTKLFCNDNKLTALDVSTNTNLFEFECQRNQISTLTLSSGLKYFHCQSNLLTALDVSANTALREMVCDSNKLATLNVSKNTALTLLACNNNKLTGLDVSKNTALLELFCNNNLITSLTTAGASELQNLYCNANKLPSLDVSLNTKLVRFDCGSNQITALDVSKCSAKLESLTCSSNQLTSLNLDATHTYQSVNCSLNRLTFLSVPTVNGKIISYIYAPQKPITIQGNTLLNTTVDLSSQFTINGNTSTYSWLTSSGAALTAGTDYTIAGGVTTFLKPQTGSVYCSMTNASFPDFSGANVLKTTATSINLPVLSFTTSLAVGDAFFLGIEANTPIEVDCGDGVRVSKTISGQIDIRLVGSQTVKIYGNVTKINFSSTGVTSLDVSQNIGLIELNVNNCQLPSIDISKNINLHRLECRGNNFNNLDLTQNNALTYLYCSHNQLATLNTGNLTNLNVLYCDYNLLTNLDLSKNNLLQYFFCNNNRLASLTISPSAFNSGSIQFNCYNNQLTFATLPSSLKASAIYTPQSAIAIAKQTTTNSLLDLSSQNSVNGVATIYNWITKGGTTLTAGTDYTIVGGKTTFLKAPSDSVYCSMTNTKFPAFVGANALTTTCIKVIEPAIVMTTAKAVGTLFTFKLEASAANTTVQVDFGNGILVNQSINTFSTSVSGTIVGTQIIKVYGNGIVGLDCNNKLLTALDVSKNTALTYLYCSNNQLTALDVSKNTALTVLDCPNNQLTALDVSTNIALINLNCSTNQLTTLNVSKNTALTLLFFYSNQLTALDVSKNTALTNLDCTNNQLTALDVSKNTALTLLDCSSNRLTALDVSKNTALTRLYCYTNQLTFATLPLKLASWTIYNYAYQGPISIAKTNAINTLLDLSSQYSVNGVATIYKWTTKGGTTLTAGTDYTIVGGKTTFLKAPSDSVYCQMTNAQFSDGYMSLNTTCIKVINPGTWTGATNTDWNEPTNWAGAAVPTSSTDVIIPSGKTTVIGATETVDCKNLTINGTLTIESTTLGTGSLIVHGTVSGTGTTNSQRYLTSGKWHIVSPIASGQNVSGFLTANTAISTKGTNRGLMDYNTGSNSWNTYYKTTGALGTMDAGKGYSARIDADGVITFTGNITSGNYTKTGLVTTGEGWNCIGNPYTSAIGITTSATSADNFLKANAIDASNLDPAYACLYLWDETNSRYDIINNAGLSSGRYLAQKYVAPGQGFFVKVKTSSVSFTSAMQSHQNNAAAPMLKSAKASWPTIQLNVAAGSNKASTVVAFNSDMTKGLDPTYDAGLLRGTTGVNLYSRLVDDNGVDFAIQALPSAEENLVIPIGVESKDGGSITFSAKTIELPANTSVVLEDKTTGTLTSLTDGGVYTAAVEAGVKGIGRFYLHTKSANTTTDITTDEAATVSAYASNKTIYINGKLAGATALLFDINGKQVDAKQLSSTSSSLDENKLVNGVYVLRVVATGKVHTFKVVLQ